MRLFKAITTVTGMREPFVDWYRALDKTNAVRMWVDDVNAQAIPIGDAECELVECDPDTLKPVQVQN